ncbi:MAG TPA: nucleotidyltransferase family protein [Candidatus Tectomicrobia bacterium]
MTRKFVSGLILAAGSSRRLGQPKQLLPYQGTILLDWALAQAEAAQGLDEVIVVLGQAADAIRPRLRITRAQVLISSTFTEGCSGSYKTGMGALDPQADAVMILLGDQPGVDTTIINQVAADWRAQGGSIALTSYRGHHGHPMVFASTLFERLLQLQGDKAAWKILDAHPEWVRHVELDRAFPEDVDTWQDYEALLRQATAPGS